MVLKNAFVVKNDDIDGKQFSSSGNIWYCTPNKIYLKFET